jgi:hypothetical protein
LQLQTVVIFDKPYSEHGPLVFWEIRDVVSLLWQGNGTCPMAKWWKERCLNHVRPLWEELGMDVEMAFRTSLRAAKAIDEDSVKSTTM